MTKKIHVMAWLLAGFMAPPLIWLGFGVYLDIWSLGEMVSIILSPWIWGYVGVVLVILISVAGKKLDEVRAGFGSEDPKVLDRSRRAVRFIPLFAVAYMGVYCTAGPHVALLGQTMGTPFLDFWEYWLAQMLGIPLILLFTVGFFITMTRTLEKYAREIPLAEGVKFLTLRGKMIVSLVFNLLGSILTLVTAAMALVHSGKEDFDQLALKLTITGVLVGVTALINLVLMIRQIVYPVENLSRVLNLLFKDFSQGQADLTRKVEVPNRDEIGYLAGYFNQFLITLAKLISALKTNIQFSGESHRALISSSADMQEQMDHLKSEAEFLTGRFHELRKSMELAGRSAGEITGYAQETSDNVDSQSQNLSKISGEFSQMSRNLVALSASAEDGMLLAGKLAKLSRTGEAELGGLLSLIQKVESSAQAIEDAVSVIQNLGDKTNLLAMNASIEAAHAGTAGRGFGVVAQEIRKLAENSQRNAVEIRGSLGTVSETATQARGSAESNAKSFAVLFESIGHVTESLGTIKEKLKEFSRFGAQASQELSETAETAAQLKTEARMVLDRVEPVTKALSGAEDLGSLTQVRLQGVNQGVQALEASLKKIREDGDMTAQRSNALEKLVQGLKTL